jgi:integrase
MMAIRKRIWTAPNGDEKTAWQVDYRDQNGKRRSKQFVRKKDADKWLVSAAWEVSQGVHTVDSESITVADATQIWVDKAIAEGRERSTVKQYKELKRLHIDPLIGAVKLSRLSMPQAEQFRDDLVASRSRAMAGKAVRALSMALTEAQRRGLVGQNVAKGVKVIRKGRDKPRMEIPTREQLRAMLAAALPEESPLIMTVILTGLRSSEIRGLRWSDIDFKADTLTVAQRADQWGVIGPPKSEAGYRTIPIAPALSTALKAWKLRAGPSPLDLVFPNATGKAQWHQNLSRRMFIPLQVRAGVSKPKIDTKGNPVVDKDGQPVLTGLYGLHSLRHAAASGWIAQRIDLKRLQVWIGHENIELTLQTYGHLLQDAGGDADLILKAGADLVA